jgi:hypothetical protein
MREGQALEQANETRIKNLEERSFREVFANKGSLERRLECLEERISKLERETFFIPRGR